MSNTHTQHAQKREGGRRKKAVESKIKRIEKEEKTKSYVIGIGLTCTFSSAQGREATKNIRLELRRNRIESNGMASAKCMKYELNRE